MLKCKIALIFLWLHFAFHGSAELFAGPESSAAIVLRATIHGAINPGAASYLKHAIQIAEKEQAQAIILHLNTPGGLMESTREIVSLISASPVPIVVYVGPEGARATSAGAFLVLASHLAVMHEGSHLGASAPVLTGGEELPPTMKGKVVSDASALMRSLAELRGRNAGLADKFVTESLSLTAAEALEKNVIDFLINQETDLLTTIHDQSIQINDQEILLNTATAQLKDLPRRLVDWFLMELANPEMAFLLVTAGLLGIYLEFASPGLLFPGLGGAVSLITGLILMYVLPAQIGFALLLIIGLSLLALEVYVAGFGAFGVVGMIAFLLGSFHLFDDPMIDDFSSTVWIVATGLGLATLLLVVMVRSGWLSTNPRNRTQLLGQQGPVMADFHGNGYVLIQGKKTAAFCEKFLARNTVVQVVEVQENGSVVVSELKP